MFYTEKDIDRFLSEARKQQDYVISMVDKVAKGNDKTAIIRAITNYDFFAEDFCRYDSDVCERFLLLMELTGIAK